MNKSNKDKVLELKKKIFERNQKEIQEVQAKELATELTGIAYDVVRIPGKGNTFELVKLRYDLDSRKAVVEGKVLLDQKVVGLTFKQHTDGLSSMFDRLNKTQNKGDQ